MKCVPTLPRMGFITCCVFTHEHKGYSPFYVFTCEHTRIAN